MAHAVSGALLGTGLTDFAVRRARGCRSGWARILSAHAPSTRSDAARGGQAVRAAPSENERSMRILTRYFLRAHFGPFISAQRTDRCS